MWIKGRGGFLKRKKPNKFDCLFVHLQVLLPVGGGKGNASVTGPGKLCWARLHYRKKRRNRKVCNVKGDEGAHREPFYPDTRA